VNNSSSTVDARYHAIAAGLAPDALTELWLAALFGRPVCDSREGPYTTNDESAFERQVLDRMENTGDDRFKATQYVSKMRRRR